LGARRRLTLGRRVLGYYATFFHDPDRMKLEVVHVP
jgi:hypothetical protein